MKQKPYSIHFVCRGNTYRSRLAAAQMHSIAGGKFTISSSGINAHKSTTKTSEAYTQAIARRHKVLYGIQSIKTQTNNELLKTADVIVFMNKDVYDEAAQFYDFDARKVIVWHTPDISVPVRTHYDATLDLKPVLTIAEHTFLGIQQHCRELLAYLNTTSWVDVVDDRNQMSGMRLPINWVTDRGLWHRGIHVIAQTSDGKFVVGKRSKTIIFGPGMLELTLGGAVDCGEQPLRAAQRETHEELGVLLSTHKFTPVMTIRHKSYHPHYHKYSRNFMYVYKVTIPIHSAHFKPQPGEVDEIRLLTRRQIKQLLLKHRLNHFGRLIDSHAMYTEAMRQGILPA